MVPLKSGSGEDWDEGSLLAAAAGGDLSAFRRLLDRHLGSVEALARRMLGDAAEAEDVAQDAFMKLWRREAPLEAGAGGAGPWLRRVAARLCLDRMRAGRHIVWGEEVPDVAEPPPQSRALEASDTAGRVTAALAGLPARQRVALTMFHYEEMSQGEIAAMMELSVAAVESLLARARQTLKKELQGTWQDLIGDGP